MILEFREVDERWIAPLALRAVAHYEGRPIRMLQIVPDPQHYTIDVPYMRRVPHDDEPSAWLWLWRPWEHSVPQRASATTNLNALMGGAVTEAARWEDDEWELFAALGPDVSRADIRVVPIGTLLAHDPTLIRVTELGMGEALPQQTLSQVVRRFDRLGRKVFESYPSRSITDFRATLPGSYTGYDALSRVSSVGIDSEHGRLTTTTNYLSGLRRQVINPRGFATVESFQAWDTPNYDLPVRIDAPEGVSTQITRDVFGKPVTISRSGPDR